MSSHNKAIEVLKRANGKAHYTEIAKAVNIHRTKASSLLKKAEVFGLAKKVKSGIYKKTPGVLGYMPKSGKAAILHTNTVQDLTKRANKKNNSKRGKPFIAGLVIPSRITSNLDKMTDSYRILYATENTLRELVRKVLNSKADWWKKNISSGIQTDVQDSISKTSYHAAKRNDELEYAHLGQLKEIIISKKNWNEFLPYLNEKNKNYFSATIDKAIPSRNAIAHSIPLDTNDLKVVNLRFEDILKMIQ